MKKFQSAKLETAIQMIAAMVLLISGYDKISTGFPISGTIILSFGILVVSLTVFRKSIKASPNQVKFLGYLIEGIALLITAYYSFKDNKVYLPYAYLLPAVVFLILAVIAVLKGNKTVQNHG